MRQETNGSSGLDQTIVRAILAFRVVALVWLMALAVSTLMTDETARRSVVVATFLIATVWTGIVLLVGRDRSKLVSTSFLLADALVAILVSSSAVLAGSTDRFFGGFAAGWLVLVAYARPLSWSLVAAAALAVPQIVAYLIGSPSTSTVTTLVGGVVIFFVMAALFWWGFQTLRESEARRREAQEALEEERRRRAMVEARAEFADRLHDSVLQTLNLIQKWADDPDQVRYLARSENRQLRRMIHEIISPFESSSLAAALHSEADEVEDLYRVTVKRVISGDCRLDGDLEYLVQATREALVNAGKHSGTDKTHLHVRVSSSRVNVLVKDRGIGFDPDSAGSDHRSLGESILRRLEDHGGRVEIRTAPGAGTEIEMEMEMRHDLHRE